jgi:hypothetical protein
MVAKAIARDEGFFAEGLLSLEKKQVFTFLCFACVLKGNFKLKGAAIDEEISHFIRILQTLGLEIHLKGEQIEVKSMGALHLFEPKEEIDVKGSLTILFALSGLFAPYDYDVFFVDSTKKLKEVSLSPLILGLWEAGIRFSYSRNFTLPISIKGTSNFLPMVHSVFKENFNLELAFFNLGLQGIGTTTVISPFNHGFSKILSGLQANFKEKVLEDSTLSLQIASLPQTKINEIEINL